MVVDGSTAMLIDGFTRSACVYAAVAFQLSQPRPVRLAHLIHSPAHIIEGVRRHVPCLVTVREPRGAVLSCLLREPQTTAGQVLAAHERFYRALLPYRTGMVVGTFDRVTRDLGGLVEQVNRRFGTDFVPPPADVAETAFDFIELRAARPPWEAQIGYVMSGLQSPETLDRLRGARHRRHCRPCRSNIASHARRRNGRRPRSRCSTATWRPSWMICAAGRTRPTRDSWKGYEPSHVPT